MIHINLVVAFAILMGNIGIPVIAQTDMQAKTMLTQVSKKYQTFSTIKVDFSYTIDNPQAKIKETQLGTLLTLAKTNKYKITLKDQELISDGTTQWTYLKSDKEVQITTADHKADALNPAKIFTFYETGFKYLYVGERTINGKMMSTIDLAPLDDKHSYFKIRLLIDKSAKLIANVLIFDKNGNRYTYSIKSILPNVKVSASTFDFDTKKYPGVEVVDLR